MPDLLTFSSLAAAHETLFEGKIIRKREANHKYVESCQSLTYASVLLQNMPKEASRTEMGCLRSAQNCLFLLTDVILF